MGEVYVWSEMDAGNWEAPRGKGKFDIETGWAQKVVERYAPTYLSSPLSSFSDAKDATDAILLIDYSPFVSANIQFPRKGQLWQFPSNIKLYLFWFALSWIVKEPSP